MQLTKQELEARNKDSLIKYVGCLQAELRLLYEKKVLDKRSEPALNSNDENRNLR